MKQGVFSVYDTKAKAYLQPFHAVNGAVACRMIADAVAEPKHMFNTHAADYVLFQLTEFDDETGGYSNEFIPVSMGSLLTFLPEASNV